MEIKLVILMGLLSLVVGCEPTLPNLQGEWKRIDKKNPYKVIITEDMIHYYPSPSTTRSCKYTISKDYLNIVRLWKSKTDIDYMSDCEYGFFGDTLVICDFTPTILSTWPPHYNDIKLVKE